MARLEGIKSCVNLKLKEKYYYPFSHKFIEFHRATHMDLMRLDDKNIVIIQEIRESWKNILKYNFELNKYQGKIPDEFEKNGCFIIGFEDFGLACYINIIEPKNNICIVFDVIQYID